MLSSLREGARGVSAERFFFIPADMPFVCRDIYLAMASIDAAGPVIPTAGGRRGHPVLVPAFLIPAIMDLPDEVPLKTLLTASGPICVDVADDSVLQDIDTPEEYEAAVRRVAGSRLGASSATSSPR